MDITPFLQHEAIARAKVNFLTWGHLYPDWGIVYRGHVDIAFDGCSEYTVVDFDLATDTGKVLECSPLSYEHFNNYACDKSSEYGPGLYRFHVDYCWNDDGTHEFVERSEPKKAAFNEPTIAPADDDESKEVAACNMLLDWIDDNNESCTGFSPNCCDNTWNHLDSLRTHIRKVTK